MINLCIFFFFFQAEDGIRDIGVTGVQTCALPILRFTPSPPDFQGPARAHRTPPEPRRFPRHGPLSRGEPIPGRPALHKEKRTLPGAPADRKSTRLNSSHANISYAVFCLKKKKTCIHMSIH